YPAPAFAVLERLVHVEAGEDPLRALGEDVAVLALHAHAAVGEDVERHREVLAVVDGPEVRDTGEEPLLARDPGGGKQEAGLALAPEGGGEVWKVRNDRDAPD